MTKKSNFFEAYDCPLCDNIHRKGTPCDATINVQQDPFTRNEIVVVTNTLTKVFLSTPSSSISLACLGREPFQCSGEFHDMDS